MDTLCTIDALVDVLRWARGLPAHGDVPHNRTWYEARRLGLLSGRLGTGALQVTDAGAAFLADHDRGR